MQIFEVYLELESDRMGNRQHAASFDISTFWDMP